MKKKVTKKKTTKKPFVIVRAHTAGVHAGYLESRKGDTVTLSKSIRLWKWMGASLSQVATTGPAPGDNKFGLSVAKTDIISPQGFEILYCSSEAEEKIKGVVSWKV